MWLLVILIGVKGLGLSGVETSQVNEMQCKATLHMLSSFDQQMGAICIGPEGQVITRMATK